MIEFDYYRCIECDEQITPKAAADKHVEKRPQIARATRRREIGLIRRSVRR